MEVFYCEHCKEWLSYDNDAYYPKIKEATYCEPIQYSDHEHCIKCDSIIDEKNIIDDVLVFLNEKKVQI